MINEKNILTRIRAADSTPTAAYATEIPSNEYVTGNLNSKYAYTQTKEENNGMGDMGTHETGDLLKSANIYLEKIASMASAIKAWPKGLIKNIKDAEPLTHVGIAAGTAMGLDKLKERHGQTSMPERSLRALQSINRKLDHVYITPTTSERS